ncbi:MAG: SRPBCC family protein [Actinomycetes bacterium]|jgi:hypothetical protein|nr:hypothetical protein [Candidatus Nanopelagicales bacterium]MDP4825120.1 hypothetical protein [Candidatus Nanopelagicales bacterium]MDP4888432.1 hypothetical protein [Candidatus Nanopelagicales bacterium]
MAIVHFTVRRQLSLPALEVFDELIDWLGHAKWVPLTRVVIEDGDGGVGTVFVATTGIGPFALPDRMRVDALDRDMMTVRIAKIGPVLTGDVALQVTPAGDATCDLLWDENVAVPVLPQFLAKPVGAVAAVAFSVSISAMAKRVHSRLQLVPHA